jgi:hypothetical protein
MPHRDEYEGRVRIQPAQNQFVAKDLAYPGRFITLIQGRITSANLSESRLPRDAFHCPLDDHEQPTHRACRDGKQG